MSEHASSLCEQENEYLPRADERKQTRSGTSAQQQRAAILIRLADDTWLAPQYVAVNAWSGALALAGDGQDLRITALAMPFAGRAPPPAS